MADDGPFLYGAYVSVMTEVRDALPGDILDGLAGDDWPQTRLFAVVFVVAFPTVLCCARCLIKAFCLDKCLSCFCSCPVHPCLYWTLALPQLLVAAALFGMWLHWVPCLWLACDLSDDDDGALRLGLWIGGGVVAALLLLLAFRSEGTSCRPLLVRNGAKASHAALPL
jgi:hypothetical protein